MAREGIERNKLDYILTDLLPVELSGRFSYRPFYEFLMEKEHKEELDKIAEKIKELCAESNGRLFEHGWGTMPLRYDIQKGNDSLRKMSLIQPLAALNIYFFMECYQKDILKFFKDNHRFSIRYHKACNDLYYQMRSKKYIKYIRKITKKIGKSTISQTGRYFKIYPFESLNAFTSSTLWRMNNCQHQYFAKVDYKSCFDSIYSHAYTWIIDRDVIDPRSMSNASLFTSIDRVLMNINGKSSNGIVVGPEYSRMIAEILLQQIDKEVYMLLLEEGYKWKRDYRIFRYVDDLYIFTNSPEIRSAIVKAYSKIGGVYRLTLNELKYYESNTPVTFSRWIEKTRSLTDKISNAFISAKEYDAMDGEKSLVRQDYYIFIERMKDEFISLITEFPEQKRTIVSFLLSTLLNKISMVNDGYQLFLTGKTKKAKFFVELAMFFYSACPCFEHSKRVLSMIIFMDKEAGFSKKGSSENRTLQYIIRRYSFVFARANLHDICDWFIFFNDFHITLDMQTENKIIKKAESTDDPIIWANILLYSHYCKSFFEEIKMKVEEIITNRISRIIDNNQMLRKEFWYILIFYNCKFISEKCKNEIDNIISGIKKRVQNCSEKECNYRSMRLLCEFMNTDEKGFFDWDGSVNMSELLSYRTMQRTLFKKYKESENGLYASID